MRGSIVYHDGGWCEVGAYLHELESDAAMKGNHPETTNPVYFRTNGTSLPTSFMSNGG